MSGPPPPPRQPRLPRGPKAVADDAILSEEEVQRRVDVRGGGTPVPPPIEQRLRDRRPTPASRSPRTGARDSLLLVGLVVVGILAIVILLPEGPLTASSTSSPSAPGTAAAAVVPSTPSRSTPIGSPSLITLPPSTAGPEPSLAPVTPVPASQAPTATATPRPAATPNVTQGPAATPKPTPRVTPTPKPTPKPTPQPTPATATVIVVMDVVNNSGGSADASDWDILFLGEAGGSAVPDNFPGSESGRSVTIPAGMGYRVIDDGAVGGYAPRSTSEGCFRADSGSGLAPGATVTCTITRNDKPRVVVIVDVTNNDSGSASAGDWQVLVSGAQASPDSFAGSGAGTTVTVSGGASYTVSIASGPVGYTQGADDPDCSGSLALDNVGPVTCTFTFDDEPPSPAGNAAPVLLVPLAIAGFGGRRRWPAIRIR